MHPALTADELVALIRRVFQPQPGEERVAFLVDLPDGRTPDTAAWRARRALVQGFVDALVGLGPDGALATRIVAVPNVGANNADLPTLAWDLGAGPIPDHADALDAGRARPLAELLADVPLWLAPTQFSATAPLKNLARALPFRAATMPGFSDAMIPALRLDYGEIQRRCERLKGWLDASARAELRFEVAGRVHALRLDLRHRHAHASGGSFPAPGQVGNLPSGETYIVPYEGEYDHEASGSAGELPVQLGDEVVVYTIQANRAVAVAGAGPVARAEAARIVAEPGYANLAELGMGVLADFGVTPIGEILLDEKLGLHIAFGRSDHFGGAVGPDQFSGPAAVVHIDRVYLPALQPRVKVLSVDLHLDEGDEVIPLMRDGRYAVEI